MGIMMGAAASPPLTVKAGVAGIATAGVIVAEIIEQAGGVIGDIGPELTLIGAVIAGTRYVVNSQRRALEQTVADQTRDRASYDASVTWRDSEIVNLRAENARLRAENARLRAALE